MKTRIIQFGNSEGVGIPKRLLEQAGLHGEVEIRVEQNALVIGPACKPRAGWAAAFREMSRCGIASRTKSSQFLPTLLPA